MFCVNEEWAKLPWNYFNSVEEHFAKLPTFVVAQCVFFLLTLGAALHARANGSRHMFVFVAALIAGTANDAFFMFLPTVDNFWQAQGLVNLTPRMPLYIPLVYICKFLSLSFSLIVSSCRTTRGKARRGNSLLFFFFLLKLHLSL